VPANFGREVEALPPAPAPPAAAPDAGAP